MTAAVQCDYTALLIVLLGNTFDRRAHYCLRNISGLEAATREKPRCYASIYTSFLFLTRLHYKEKDALHSFMHV